MSKRIGLGKGLGAFFGEDYEIEATKKNVSMGITAVKESDDKGSAPKESDKDTSNRMEKKQNLEAMDMVLPTSNKKKTASPVKTVEKVKIVEVEKEKTLNISMIEPNREQPRKAFDEEQLNELASSIREYGILQPLLVQKKNDYYEIIAGERRWRAARVAGIKEIPVIIREYSRQETMEIALIENVQREDLNPIEEARAYHMLIQEFGLKQEEVAERVSRNRATITNSLRLLKLDEGVQDMLIQGKISGGHARALLTLEKPEQQKQVAERIVTAQLSVREVEKLVKSLTKEKTQEKKEKKEEQDLSLFYRDLEDRLKSVIGTKVNINKKDKNKGRIEIEYYSSAELERIAELLQTINS